MCLPATLGKAWRSLSCQSHVSVVTGVFNVSVCVVHGVAPDHVVDLTTINNIASRKQ